jgi:hypothetical protein
MNTELLIAQGNELRAQHRPLEALKCYAQAFVDDPDSPSAWNNYGNVLRECGQPARSIPFLEHARILDPSNVTAEFNLGVAYLAVGEYAKGWSLYESRWRYEHLAGTKPQLSVPEWNGQDLKGKTLLVVGEQGLGDQIQFLRFCGPLQDLGAKLRIHVTSSIKPLLINTPPAILSVTSDNEEIGEFDYWVSMMSVPRILNIGVKELQHYLQYITVDNDKVAAWAKRLGPKNRMRIGIAWSGRKDSWINQHKSMPVEVMAEFVKNHPEHEWISLQVDASDEESAIIQAAGVHCYPGTIASFADSAALMHHLDLVISVDTAAAHLAGALGRPLWMPLNLYGTCWRWMQNTDSSPWYTTARLFRQETFGDWQPVIKKIEKYLSWFKI